jgi:excisionase family DNA binding protein
MKVGKVEVITLSEAARRYGIDRTALFRQAQKGVLKAEQSGKSWLVRTDDMDKYVRDHSSGEGRRGRPRKPKEGAE